MESQPPAVQVGDVLASKYRVERVLGQGGMGMVVAARHEQLGFQVALKFMLPVALGDLAMKERFLREAQAAGRLRSEHVARVMDFGTLDDGAPYIVMEFLHGSDLQGVLDKVGILPPHEAAEYVLQACKAMQEAHGQGIVHRDLKPQNLFLTHRPDGTPLVKVLDFGISKLVGHEASLSVTSSSAMMGSPLYMAPEQIRSAKKVDARADIYSLGAILYQLLTGQVPIPAETLGELFEHVFTRPTVPPRSHRPDVSPELEAVVMRCLAKTAEDRYQSVGDLAAALAPFVDPRRSLSGFQALTTGEASGAPVAASTGVGPTTTLGKAAAVSERTPAGVPRGGRGWLIAGVAVAAIAAAGVVVVRAGPRRDAAATTTPAVSPPSAPLPSAVLAPPPDPAPSIAALPSSAPSSAPSVAVAPTAAPTSPPPGAGTRPSRPTSPVAPPTVAGPATKPTPPRPTAKPGADPFSTPD